MKENNNKGRGVFYGVIGIATLVVAIIGATFAYFTSAASGGENEITGNMANIGFSVNVTKVVDPSTSSGMIPMSNNMIQAAGMSQNSSSTPTPCVDVKGAAVCQIYKIEVSTTSVAAMFVDGYVALTGGSGTPADATLTRNQNNTMRWVQVFKQGGANVDDAEDNYSTSGTQVLGTGGSVQFNSPLATTETTALNGGAILTSEGDIINETVTIDGNSYDAVGTNFIRISDHTVTGGTIDPNFTRSDLTSMLVINQQISSTAPATYYVMVWLAENGHDQSAGANANAAATTEGFFNGLVKFISGQGSEVTATFSGYTAVPSDSGSTQQPVQTTP